MSSSGLLAFYVATDAVVSIVKWYTFMCASDGALAAYRWRMKFNGRFGLHDHALCKPSLFSLNVANSGYLELFFIGMNLDKATR